MTSNKFISHRSFYFLAGLFFFLKTGQLETEATKEHKGCFPYDRSDHNDGMETYKSMTISQLIAHNGMESFFVDGLPESLD